MLGEYKLNEIYNEDSYKAIKKIPDKSIDCIYTDIPYIIQSGGASESPLSQRAKRLRNEDLKDIKDGIDYSILDDFVRVMKNVNIFIWCSKEQINDIMNYFLNIDKKTTNFEILVWAKDNPTPLTNNTWLPDIEHCLYFREKGVKLNDGYENKSKWYSSPINKRDKDLFEHPTIKPLNLVKRHLLHTTQPNDIVADFFLGSGTTAVACRETGRQYIGFEIDKKWYDIAVDRLNGITAKGQYSLF
jgi:DNA modification methylase